MGLPPLCLAGGTPCQTICQLYLAHCAAEDRAFVPWLVAHPTEQEAMRCRRITPAQIAKLEELWKKNGKATVDDIDKPGEDDEPAQVSLR